MSKKRLALLVLVAVGSVTLLLLLPAALASQGQAGSLKTAPSTRQLRRPSG
jgi:hypothetical protein